MLPNRRRLFVASCAALVATAMAFSIRADIMNDMKGEFLLSDEQLGWIAGAGIWGFSVSIFIWGALIDVLGMRTALWTAFAGHIVGSTLVVFVARSFWPLFLGWLVIALANGMVEAAINPLAATIYADKKTHMLNMLHAWWPGGLVIGGLLGFGLSNTIAGSMSAEALWRVKVAFVYLPAILYGALIIGQQFPKTERVQAQVSTGQMFLEVLRPGFLILLLCMFMTASMELGPDQWIAVLTGKLVAGMPGILVLVWTAGLMFLLRFFAGPLVHKLSALGLLIAAAIISGLGLTMLSYAQTGLGIMITATVFGIGKAYFWPTMLGTVSERYPKGGALTLGLMGGGGMLIVGLVAAPQMGHLQDIYFRANLSDSVKTLVVVDGKVHQDKVKAVREGTDEKAKQALADADKKAAAATLRWVASLSIILIVIFGGSLIRERMMGGFKHEKLDTGASKGGSGH
jgi:MFS family permease